MLRFQFVAAPVAAVRLVARFCRMFQTCLPCPEQSRSHSLHIQLLPIAAATGLSRSSNSIRVQGVR